jgi:hypothetical protein
LIGIKVAFCLFISSYEIVFVKNGIERYMKNVHQIRQKYPWFQKKSGKKVLKNSEKKF